MLNHQSCPCFRAPACILVRSPRNLGTLVESIGATLMEQSQNEVRRAAAAAFKRSLNQLEQQLQTAPAAELADAAVNPSDPALPLAQPLPPIDLQALEDAAADIERLMRSKAQEPEGGCQEPEGGC